MMMLVVLPLINKHASIASHCFEMEAIVAWLLLLVRTLTVFRWRWLVWIWWRHWRWSPPDARNAALDRETVKCIGGLVCSTRIRRGVEKWCQRCCIRPWNSQMHWRVVWLSNGCTRSLRQSNALTVVWLSEVASDSEAVRCFDKLSVRRELGETSRRDQKCCTRFRCS